MKKILVFLSVLCALYSGAESLSMAQLQGSWTCVYTERNFVGSLLSPDAMVSRISGKVDYLIRNDSVFAFHYPCEFYWAYPVFLRGDSLFRKDNRWHAAKLQLRHDTLIETSYDDMQVLNKSVFVRASYDLQQVRKLQKNRLDAACFLGNMKLVTHFYRSGEEPDTTRLPLPLPAVFSPAKTDLDLSGKEPVIYILVSGERKKFYIVDLNWTFENGDGDDVYHENKTSPEGNGIMFVAPAEWWTGQKFTAAYEMNFPSQ